LDEKIYTGFSDEQWRYYLYIYYRQVEMLDAEVGRLLDALDDTKQAKNTVVIFTADHGDGRGRHMNVSKWYPYEESVKVPMLLSCPDRMEAGLRDTTHLVSGLDVMSTVCDFAGEAPPPHALGRSLRPLAEGRRVDGWREFVVADTHVVGRMLRTPCYKYVRYENDPIEQLFDMQADPWETVNIAEETRVADVMAQHRRLLDDWEGRLQNVEPTPSPLNRRGKRRG
jgi:arylsulfatase A-like enzyme